jgi:hypothetical protein
MDQSRIPAGRVYIGLTADGQVQLATKTEALSVRLDPSQLIQLGLTAIDIAGDMLKAGRPAVSAHLSPAVTTQVPAAFHLEVAGNA